MVSREEFLKKLKQNELSLPPVTLSRYRGTLAASQLFEPALVIEAKTKELSQLYNVEYSSRWTPKAFSSAIARILTSPIPKDVRNSRNKGKQVLPLLVMPYLTDDQLSELERKDISGLDLCGNGVLIVPGKLRIVRAGSSNRYPQSTPIKNIYRGNSSLVPRVFLSRPQYPSVNEIKIEIERRNGSIALSTVSKALTSLEEDLIIEKRKGNIRLLQPEKLLEKLSANYQSPTIRKALVGKLTEDQKTFKAKLEKNAKKYNLQICLTGASSTNFYAVMAQEAVLYIYCSELSRLLDGVTVNEAHRFPDVSFSETSEPFVYFDSRFDSDCPAASPVQTYLELAQGDKREVETSMQVRAKIFEELKQKPNQ